MMPDLLTGAQNGHLIPDQPVSTRTRPDVIGTSIPTVVICIPTCKRPQNLAELLRSLQQLNRDGIDVGLVVVDNDPDRSARDVVNATAENTDIPVTYDCVEERNLPVVRNRLVALASGMRPDWLWFLDDDQSVEPDALQHMLTTAVTYSADCVVGRVPHVFDPSPRPWAQWSHLFDEVYRPTGQPTKRFGTNGPLVRYAALAAISGPFDPELKFSGGHHGGEDSHLFTRLHSLGYTSVGCGEAVIYDRVHSSRNNPSWLTGRARRIGEIKGFLVREIDPSALTVTKWLIKGIGYAGINGLMTAITVPFGPERFFPFWIRSVQGYGVILGIVFGRRVLHGRNTDFVHGR